MARFSAKDVTEAATTAVMQSVCEYFMVCLALLLAISAGVVGIVE